MKTNQVATVLGVMSLVAFGPGLAGAQSQDPTATPGAPSAKTGPTKAGAGAKPDGKKPADGLWALPSVSYSADVTYDYGPRLKVVTAFYYTPSRQRLDYGYRGARRITIVYTDSRLVFELLPRQKVFRKKRVKHLPAWNFGVSRPETERRRVGEEVVGGIKTVKYAVSAKTPYGETFEGHAWLDADRVVVKLDGVQRRGKQARKVVMTLANLRKAPIPQALFNVPAGFKEVPYRKK